MKTLKSIIFLVCLLSFNLTAFSQDSLSIAREFIESGYKNFAFCNCLINSNSKDSTIIKEFDLNDGSKAGYFEIIGISFEDAEMLYSLAKKYSNKYYASKYDKSLLLMKCLDFYNSSELRDSVNSIINRCKECYFDPEELKYYYERAMIRKKNMEAD